MSYGAPIRPFGGGPPRLPGAPRWAATCDGRPIVPRSAGPTTAATLKRAARRLSISARERRSSLSGVLRRKALVHGFDEHFGCPGRISAETRVVIARHSRGLDLVDRKSFRDHRPHAVANDRHHVAIVGDIGRVGEPAVA